MKKLISLMLCLALVMALPALAADGGTVTVSLRVEGVSENLGVWKNAPLSGEAGRLTVADVVRQLVGEGHYIETEGPYGAYFSSIYGEAEGMGTYGGWSYCVNGEAPSVSMDQYVLQGGEDIVLYYGDLNTLFPAVKTDAGLLTLTAKVWQEGEGGAWVQAEQPIAGVSVFWNGEKAGETDEKGQLVLPQSQPGTYTLQIRKDGEAIAGSDNTRFMPAVVRLAADTAVTVEQAPVFSDLPRGHRAYDAVMALYRDRVVLGKPGGVFGTEDALTRAEAAVLLYRLAGSPVITEAAERDLSTDAWYYSAVNWAFSLNIFQREGAFEPGTAVTAGELAGYIAAYCGHSVELPKELGIYEPVSRADAAILLAGLR